MRGTLSPSLPKATGCGARLRRRIDRIGWHPTLTGAVARSEGAIEQESGGPSRLPGHSPFRPLAEMGPYIGISSFPEIPIETISSTVSDPERSRRGGTKELPKC